MKVEVEWWVMTQRPSLSTFFSSLRSNPNAAHSSGPIQPRSSSARASSDAAAVGACMALLPRRALFDGKGGGCARSPKAIPLRKGQGRVRPQGLRVVGRPNRHVAPEQHFAVCPLSGWRKLACDPGTLEEGSDACMDNTVSSRGVPFDTK